MAAAAAANGAPDYSAQWAEYYRSQGKIKEAEEIEAQMKQKVRSFLDFVSSYRLPLVIFVISKWPYSALVRGEAGS